MATFTATGVGSAVFVKSNTTFRLSITNTWAGTWQVQESRNGGIAYEIIDQGTANFAQDYESRPYDRVVRLAMTAYTSGTLTYTVTSNAVTIARGPTKYQTTPIGQVAYTSINTNGTASTNILLKLSSLVVDFPFTTTGAAVLNGTTVGTDKLIYLLYDVTGSLVLNTDTAGTTTANASTFQEIAWAQGPRIIPAGNYYLGYQINGTTDTVRLVVTSTNVNLYCGEVASVFGTAAQFIVPPVAFTTAKGPVAYIY